VTDVAIAPEAAPPIEDAAPDATPPSRRSALMRSGALIGLLVVVFAVVLPRFVDYGAVVTALQALDLEQLIVMTVLSLAAFVVSGLLFVAVMPGLTVLRGTIAYLVLTGIGASIPFGPWNMGVTWVVLRGWRYPNRTTVSGIALYGLISWLARVALPPLVLIVLALDGELFNHGDRPLLIILISSIVFVVACVLIAGIVSSDRLAAWIGRAGQRAGDWFYRLFRRPHGPDIEHMVLNFRDQVGDVLRRRGVAALVVGVLGHVGWTILLIISLRITGVPAEAISPGEVFAIYGLVNVVTIIPIAPGGAGIPELLFIGTMTGIAGTQYTAEITAGVFLFRLYEWFLPIPLSWVMLKFARWGRPILPSTAELRAMAASEPEPAKA
jgi:uncharacterized membrane protein YbhN (UPF0104 family)